MTRFGIITSREQFLAALKRKRIERSEYEQVLRMARTAEKIGAQSGTTKPAKYENRRLSDVQIQGTTANMSEIRNLDLDAGRFFTEMENEHRAFVAVIGSDVREELFRGSTRSARRSRSAASRSRSSVSS